MKCEKYFDAIDDLVEGELDEQTAGEVNLHISACPECASRYEILALEKKTYARYLFDIEPPVDLTIKFREKLNSEANNIPCISRIQKIRLDRKAGIAGFLRLHPVSAGLVVMIGFGIGLGLLKFMPNVTMRTEKEFAMTKSGNIQFPTAKPAKIDRDTTTDLSSEAKGNDYIASSKSIKKSNENKFSNAKRTADINFKFGAVKHEKIRKQINPANGKENLAVGSQPSKEEQIRISQLRNLEKETARQIEKIELLLRSFRNARTVEGGEAFDVSYEKQQAKKLLEKNIQLRLIAETYGTLYTEEILSQVEPFLLDISHLEINPSHAEVLEIKERVKNQNLIARLQVFY